MGAVKGKLMADHIPLNKYKLTVLGLPALTITKITGLEEELEVVDLPDRTKATGGTTKAVEFEIETPMHHLLEQAVWEAWYKEGQDPVSPTYKKVANLEHSSGTGKIVRSYSLVGMFVRKRKTPDLEMKNEGELATVTWSCCADEVTPI